MEVAFGKGLLIGLAALGLLAIPFAVAKAKTSASGSGSSGDSHDGTTWSRKLPTGWSQEKRDKYNATHPMPDGSYLPTGS